MVDLGVTKKPRTTPCQVEDLIGVASPLDVLFGVREGQVSEGDISAYLGGIERLSRVLRAVPEDQVRNAVERQVMTVQGQIAHQRR